MHKEIWREYTFLLERKETMGADDFEEGRGNGQTTAFKSSSSSEGSGMQVCVRGDENGGLEHDCE